MNVLVLNGSPSGENSITLYTMYYIEKHCPSCHFEYLPVGQQIRRFEKDFSEAEEALRKADLIVFCYPVYTFLVPSQLHRFIELMKENNVDLKGKYATQVSTSKHFYDTTAHRFIQDNCADLGLKYIRGLSADMEDLLTKKGRKEALSFWYYVLWNYKKGFAELETVIETEVRHVPVTIPEESVPDRKGKVVVVADMEKGSQLDQMVQRFSAAIPMEVSVVNIRDFPFAGGCLGCFHCASDGKCIYKDGFDDYLRENIQSADATVYAFTVKDHSMGYRFKVYDDRQFCNGHRTVTMGKPVGYLVEGSLETEQNLKTLMEARAQVGGNFLAGIVSDQADPDSEIDRLSATLSYCVRRKYLPPKNFYGVGGLKIFRDLIYQMQGLMREDHRFYKKHGFYEDYPQKHKGKIAAMYLVGGMMRSKSLSKKIGGKMTEGMIMPYKKVLK